MRLGLLASGGLGSQLLHHLAGNKKYKIVCIFTDQNSSQIHKGADNFDIPVFIGNPREGRAAEFIKDKQIDVLLSVNYLFLIEKDLIQWPDQMAINVHGSLLPKYRGRTPHVWAIINNERETGITAHEIDEGCDTGDILKQIKIPIGKDDTGASILEKFREQYPVLIDQVLASIESGKIIPQAQNEKLATHFNKRSPEDGHISWSWQKERIRNWVRAQAFPYPGAFTYVNDQKVIIDKVQFDEWGFRQEMPDGYLLTSVPLRVKCPNGVLRIVEMRTELSEIKKGVTLK